MTQIQKDRLAEESVNYIIQCNFNSDKSEFVSKKDIEPEGAWQKSYNEKDFPKSLLAIYFKDTVSVQSISGPVKMTEIFFDLSEDNFSLPTFSRSINGVVKYSKCSPIDPLCALELVSYMKPNMRPFCESWHLNLKKQNSPVEGK